MHTSSIADDVFTETKVCNHEDVLICDSTKRIKNILHKLNEFNNITNDIFAQNDYTCTKLLNDFDHVKYDHHLEDNNSQFEKILTHITDGNAQICNIEKCKYINTYYRDRSKYSTEHHDIDNENKFMLDLLSRIHVYFIHSYQINRLTSNEMQKIDQKLNALSQFDALDKDEKDIDDELLEEKTIELTTHFMKQKISNLNIARNHSKYIEADNVQTDTSNDDSVNYKKIHEILQLDNISITETVISDAFGEYKNDKNKLISHVIDTYYSKNEKSSQVNNKLDNNEIRTIYQSILYKYINKSDLNTENFIKIIRLSMSYDFDIDEFESVATHENVSGKIFVKQTPQFLNKVKFAKLFTSIKGYKKKQICRIWNEINTWKPKDIAHELTPNEARDLVNDEKIDEAKENDENETEYNDKENKDVYDLGTRYYYWESHRYHKDYIDPNHKDLKNEMIHNKLVQFDITQWNYLQNECKVMINTVVVKRIVSNGYHQTMYHIELFAPFSIQHLIALKLYTDYTDLCGTFCSTLRSEKEIKIAEIANLARLLSECVQCYGSLLKTSKIKKYYRGVKKAFMFEMFVTRFNLPTSTTIDFQKAVQFTDATGLVLELSEYRSKYDVFQFECEKLSAFPAEKEVLFFGGDSVLKLSSILQWYNNKWSKYKKYLEPMNAIVRMLNGLSIAKKNISTNEKQQRMMVNLMDHVLRKCIAETSNNSSAFPPYIEDLLTYHTTKSIIKFNFHELRNEYSWMESKFIKQNNNDQKMIAISNISLLFCNSDNITFLMPNNYILETRECESLIIDLVKIAEMNICTDIKLEWPNKTPTQNIHNINAYLQILLKYNWKRLFSTNSVLFVRDEFGYSVRPQQLFEAQAKQMLSTTSSKLKRTEQEQKEIQHVVNIPNVIVSKKSIKAQYIDTVQGFVREYEGKLTVPDLINLILFFYAKPIIMNVKYKSDIKTFLYCPLEPEFVSIQREIIKAFNLHWYCILHSPHGKITKSNWHSCRWSETDLFMIYVDEETLAKRHREMRRYVTMAKGADAKLSKKIPDAELKEYAQDRGKMLYLFYLKMFDIQFKENGKSWIHDVVNKSDEKKEKDTNFDASKPDPFESIYTQWKELNQNERRGYLEEIWDKLLSNSDELNVDAKTDDEKEMFSARKKVLLGSQADLTEFERKVYLLKFCIFVGPTINKMDDINKVDLVKVYKDANTILEDMMVPNNDGENACLIM